MDNVLIWGMNIVAEEDGDTYKVIAIANSRQVDIAVQIPWRIEIYDSSMKSWSTIGLLTQNLKPTWRERKMLFVSEDFLYCFGMELHFEKKGIVIFSVQNRASIGDFDTPMFTFQPRQDSKV